MKHLRRLRRSIKHWWQRRTRGWDDSELWNLDHTLAKLIAPRLRRFAETTHGYPGGPLATEEQWAADLHAMIYAFDLLASGDFCDVETDEESAKVQYGLFLFAKWYRALWD